MTKSVYIVGSKGIPAKYGGFETFVEKLTEFQQDKDIQYYVACMRENSAKSGITADTLNITVLNATILTSQISGLHVPSLMTLQLLIRPLKLLRKTNDQAPIFYVLACRIGPFISGIKKKIKAIGGTLMVNPDGHEWLRAKWSLPVRKYWKISEQLMVKHADLLICDSKNIESYIQKDYAKYRPQTTYIAYGTDTTKSRLTKVDDKVRTWYFERVSLKTIITLL